MIVCLIRYYKAAGKLGNYQLVASHVFMACSVITGWTATLLWTDNEKQYSKICWSSESMNSSYFIYHTWLRIIAALLSVLLFFVVVVLMRIRVKKAAPMRNLSQQNITVFNKRQLRFTVSMGISCLFTCIFYIFPICVELYTVIVDSESQTLGFVTTYSLIISNLSPISNVIIVFHRHVDIRRSLLSLISCGAISSTHVSATLQAIVTTVRTAQRLRTSTVAPSTRPHRSFSRSMNE
uniref:G-protein coupled receptors family 1 profile domain-containing protein n=1 Tax=Plectus sambesii TaxID=2011161 RepID=A0A914V2U0_9BILA